MRFRLLGPKPPRVEARIERLAIPPGPLGRASDLLPATGRDETATALERGLRDWFICCAWRDGTELAMPSRLAEAARREFARDEGEYAEFGASAFGRGWQDRVVGSERRDRELLSNTVAAWDRSSAGRARESVLWDLDARLGLADDWGLTEQTVRELRAGRGPTATAGENKDPLRHLDGRTDNSGYFPPDVP